MIGLCILGLGGQGIFIVGTRDRSWESVTQDPKMEMWKSVIIEYYAHLNLDEDDEFDLIASTYQIK